MTRKSQHATRPIETSDALPFDVLKSIIGGAGPEKKQDLTAERAAALTAGAETAAVTPGPQALTTDDVAKIEKALRGEPIAVKVAAGTAITHYETEWKAGPKEAKDAEPAGPKEAKKAEWQTPYDKRAAETKDATEAFGKAQSEAKAKDDAHAKAQAEAEHAAKLRAEVKNAERDLARAQAHMKDAGKGADAVKSQEERLAKAHAAVKDTPAQSVLDAKAKTAAEALTKAKEAEAKAKTKADDLTARNTKAAVDDEAKQKSRDTLKNAVKDRTWSQTGTLAHEALLEAAKDEAIKNGSHSKTNNDKQLAGGASRHIDVDKTGDVTAKTQTDTVAQVKIEAGTESYSGKTGRFASAAWAIKAEAGKEITHSETDAKTGATTTTVDKAHASASFENKAKFQATWAKVGAEAETKVAVQAEASTSVGYKKGNLEFTHTLGVKAQAEAGAKAGASIGIDGLKAEIGASAEAKVKASMTDELKIGGVKVKNELEVYAAAKAEAKAEAEVNFNPFSGEKLGAKVSVGAEASAGVGIQDTLSINDRLDIGGGVYLGKIGAKADVDVGVKDGKLNVSVDVGAALGVGVSVKFKAQADFKQTASKAAEEIRNGNVAQKVGGVLSFVPTVFIFRSLFG